MPDPVSLAEAKVFLRVSHDDEDDLISTCLEAAKVRIEGVTALSLSETAPAPLRLCVLYLVAQAYQNRGEVNADLGALDAWLRPYLPVRL